MTMRKGLKVAMLLAIAAITASAISPASAASLYQMNGQGSITLKGPGIPACTPGAAQGNCTSPDQAFSWGALTVQGAGLLQDKQVIGQYACASESTTRGNHFESRIFGNTSNFELTFNFSCTPLAGAVGPAHIVGWFSNVTSTAVAAKSPAYHNVSIHPLPSPVAPGAFAFKGFFTTDGSLNPYKVNASNGVPMACGGGFAPTNFDSTHLTSPSAAFVGDCQAVAA
ncbi:MAG: hypothetical protein NVSMB57_09920 [Actinomycetota bacterium]